MLLGVSAAGCSRRATEFVDIHPYSGQDHWDVVVANTFLDGFIVEGRRVSPRVIAPAVEQLVHRDGLLVLSVDSEEPRLDLGNALVSFALFCREHSFPYKVSLISPYPEEPDVQIMASALEGKVRRQSVCVIDVRKDTIVFNGDFVARDAFEGHLTADAQTLYLVRFCQGALLDETRLYDTVAMLNHRCPGQYVIGVHDEYAARY